MEECVLIPLIKARTLEHRQPRKEARDKNQHCHSSSFAHWPSRGRVRRDNSHLSHVKSIMGRLHGEGEQKTTLRETQTNMESLETGNLSEFKDIKVNFWGTQRSLLGAPVSSTLRDLRNQ